MVANAFGDPRWADPVLPDDACQSATILPVRSPRNGKTLAVVGLLGSEPGAPIARPAVRDSVLSLVTVALQRSIDERRLAHQATHDELTGLLNRQAFDGHLQRALEEARSLANTHALCYLDLDQFKLVNDTCGHLAGDELLCRVTALLQDSMRDTDLVARLGGDEFALLVTPESGAPPGRDALLRRAAQVREVVSRPVEVLGHAVSMNVAIGGVLRGEPGTDARADGAELLHQPDLLSYFQKRLQGMPEFDLPIIHQIQDALGEVKPLIDVGDRRIPPETVKKINEITTRLGQGIVTKN
jgi:diguanylate cyclase (GGDEF)-like protein